jgi:hypothetical protein
MFGCLVGVVIVFGELPLFLGCLLGAYLFCGFFWVSCGFGVLLLLLRCLLGAYLCFLHFWGFSLSFGFPLFLWASWVVPLYTSCVLRALYAFFNKIFLLIKKKYSRVTSMLEDTRTLTIKRAIWKVILSLLM